MNIKDAVKSISCRYRYAIDEIRVFDWWFVMPEKNGYMYGDCDDFAITAIWLACNRNPFVFIWKVLILHQYRIYFCKTARNNKHVVGYVDGYYFDNWTMEALPEKDFFNKTKHKKKFFIPGPLIAFNMLLGAFVRNK